MENYKRSESNKSNVQDDPNARKLLQQANEKTYRWPKDFPGFSADLICEEAGLTSKGPISLKPPRDLKIGLDNENLNKWAEGQIGMMAVHRSARPFDQSDGKYSLTLADPDHHPMGQLIHIHGDGMGSHYRVKGDRITQINRNMHQIRFTINVEDSLTTEDGKYLTTRYTVYYFSPNDNRLTNAESYFDQHAVINGIYLPGTRTITFVENQEVKSRKLQFKNHVLL